MLTMKLFFPCSLALACCAIAAESTITHHQLAQEVIALLSETELLLSTCQDSESVQAALPQLQQLAEQAEAIRQKQLALPDSTLQEDLEIYKLVQDFQMLWNAVQDHIDRLINDGLMSPELSKILKISHNTTK